MELQSCREDNERMRKAQEEEADRLKMQGNQSTIEMSFGRSKRTRPPKGVITPSLSGKKSEFLCKVVFVVTLRLPLQPWVYFD